MLALNPKDDRKPANASWDMAYRPTVTVAQVARSNVQPCPLVLVAETATRDEIGCASRPTTTPGDNMVDITPSS